MTPEFVKCVCCFRTNVTVFWKISSGRTKKLESTTKRKTHLPKPSTNKSLTVLYTKTILFGHCDVKCSSFQSSLSLFSVKKMQWWLWQWIMKNSIYCNYWDTVWVSFCGVAVCICFLRRLCVYQVIVLYASKRHLISCWPYSTRLFSFFRMRINVLIQY